LIPSATPSHDAAGSARDDGSPSADPAWAVVLSEVFQAPLVLAALLVVIPWSVHGTLASLAWGVAAALAVCGVSLATVTVLARRGVL
ncbi:hypothetical protein GUG69_06405, partial [Xanthomonas citri pv. citri]|nr:hypothetical protein [Xanthomonas citri pv. citri]